MEQFDKALDIIKIAHQNRLRTIEKFNGNILLLLETPQQTTARMTKQARDQDFDEWLIKMKWEKEMYEHKYTKTLTMMII